MLICCESVYACVGRGKGYLYAMMFAACSRKEWCLMLYIWLHLLYSLHSSLFLFYFISCLVSRQPVIGWRAVCARRCVGRAPGMSWRGTGEDSLCAGLWIQLRVLITCLSYSIVCCGI